MPIENSALNANSMESTINENDIVLSDFKDSTLTILEDIDESILKNESLSPNDLEIYCQYSASEANIHIPPLPTLIQLIRKLENQDQGSAFIAAFNTMLSKKPFIAIDILKQVMDIWTIPPKKRLTLFIDPAREALITQASQTIAQIYYGLPAEFKNDPAFFRTITNKLKATPELSHAFQQKVLKMLFETEKAAVLPILATVFDNSTKEKRAEKNDDLLLDYCHYLMRHPENSSKAALEKLAIRLKTDEGYNKFGDIYKDLIKKPGIAEKFVLTPDLLYALSVRKSGKSLAKRENRILLAWDIYKANLTATTNDIASLPPQVITQLAYDLLTAFSKEPAKIGIILNTLSEKKYTDKDLYLKKTADQLLITIKELLGVKHRSEIKNALRNPETMEALWFQKGRVLLTSIKPEEINEEKIDEINRCFETSFNMANNTINNEQSPATSVDDEDLEDTEEALNKWSRPTETNVKNPVFNEHNMASAELASRDFEENHIHSIITLLLKTHLPKHENLWQFFSNSHRNLKPEDCLYEEDKRVNLILHLLETLFPSDKAKTPILDSIIWSRALEFLIAQVNFLTSNHNDSTDTILSEITDKIKSCRPQELSLNDNDIVAQLSHLFDDKEIIHQDKIIFQLMTTSVESAIQKALQFYRDKKPEDQEKWIGNLVNTLIKNKESLTFKNSARWLIALLNEQSLTAEIKQYLITTIKSNLSSNPSFSTIFFDAIIETMSDSKESPALLQQLLPEQWEEGLQAKWNTLISVKQENAADFIANALSQQLDVLPVTTQFLNTQPASFRLKVLARFFELAHGDKKDDKKLSFLLAITITDMHGEDALALLSLILMQIDQDKIVEKNNWVTLKIDLYNKILSLSNNDISSLKNGLMRWPQLEKDVVEYLKKSLSSETAKSSLSSEQVVRIRIEANTSRRNLLALLSSEKQKEVVQSWLKTDASNESLRSWTNLFVDYANRIALINSPDISQKNKTALQKILFQDLNLYTNNAITNEQLRKLFIVNSTDNEATIQHMLSNNGYADTDKEQIFLRILEITSTAPVDSRLAATAYMTPLLSHSALAWSILNKTDSTTKDRLRLCFNHSDATTLSGKEAIRYYFSQAILSINENHLSLPKDSTAREYVSTIDFWLSYFDKDIEETYLSASRLPKLKAIIKQLDLDEATRLLQEANSQLADLNKLDSSHREDIILACAEAVKKYPESLELVNYFSTLLTPFYLEDASLFSLPKLLDFLSKKIGFSADIQQLIIKTFMSNGRIARNLPEARSEGTQQTADKITSFPSSYFILWFSELSNNEQNTLFENVKTNGLLPWILSLASNEENILALLRRATDAQKIAIMEQPGVMEKMSVKVVEFILTTIESEERKSSFCQGILLASNFNTNENLQKHEFALGKYLPLAECEQCFDTAAGFDVADENKYTQDDLNNIQRWGMMLLTKKQGISSLMLPLWHGKGLDNQPIRLDKFKFVMMGNEKNASSNPFWFSAHMLNKISEQSLKAIFDNLLSFDETALEENTFTVENIFQAINDPNGLYAKQSKESILLLKTLIEYLSEKLDAQNNNIDETSLTAIQILQIKANLNTAWNSIISNLDVSSEKNAEKAEKASKEQWYSFSQEQQLSLLHLLDKKTGDIIALRETAMAEFYQLDRVMHEKENAIEAATGRAVSMTERKQLFKDSPERADYLKKVEYRKNDLALYEKIYPLYINNFDWTFNPKNENGLSSVNSKDKAAAYWKLCQEQLSTLTTVVIGNVSLVEVSIENMTQILLNASLHSHLSNQWKAFQMFFETLRQKEPATDGFCIIGLVNGLNTLIDKTDAHNIKIEQEKINAIPLESLDWLVHQLANEEDIDEKLMSALMHRYTTAILLGTLAFKSDDDIFQKINLRTSEKAKTIRQGIHKAIGDNAEIIQKNPEKLPLNLRAFFLNYCYQDGILTTLKTIVPIIATLLQLPEFLYNDQQINAIKATSGKIRLDLLTQPINDWTQKIENALIGLNVQNRHNILPLFQALLAYYANTLNEFKQDLNDGSNIILDRFAEVTDKIAVFFGVSIDILLQKCDTELKSSLLKEAFSGIKAARIVKIQTACNTSDGVKNYREIFFGKIALTIPEDPRALSYTDGDIWHVFPVQSSKEWGIIGRCSNNIPPKDPAVIEFFATCSQDSELIVRIWDQSTQKYISYSSEQTSEKNWQTALGQGMTQCLQAIAEKTKTTDFNALDTETNKIKSIQELILKSPSLSEIRQQRSKRLLSQWIKAAIDTPEANTFKQETINTLIQRNELNAISASFTGFQQTALQKITGKSSGPINIDTLNNMSELDKLKTLQEEYVVLRNWLTNVEQVASLDDSTLKVQFTDCLNTLRERIPVFLKIGKDTSEKRQQELKKEIQALEATHPEFNPPSKIITLAEHDYVIGNVHFTLTMPLTNEELSALSQCQYTTAEAFQKTCQQNSVLKSLTINIIPENALLLRESKQAGKSTGYTVEIIRNNQNQGTVFLSSEQYKQKESLFNKAPSSQLDYEIKKCVLIAKQEEQQWAIQRAKQFSADDYLIIVINTLRENIEAINKNPRATLTQLELAQRASNVISNYLQGEFQEQYAAKTITQWVTRGLEEAVRKMIGGDVEQCESVLSRFLSKQRLNVAKAWGKDRKALPPQTLYIRRDGQFIAVATTPEQASQITENTRNYSLKWTDAYKTTEQASLYYQAMHQCDRLIEKKAHVQQLIEQRQKTNQPLFEMPYGHLPTALSKINTEIAEQQARKLPDEEQLKSTLQSGETLYDSHKRPIGLLNQNLCLEQDLLYGERTWLDILISEPLNELKASEDATNIALLDVINQGLLPELLKTMHSSSLKDKAHFLRYQLQHVLLHATPFLSKETCQELMQHYSSDALLQFINAYNDSNDQGGYTRQALLEAVLLSPKHMPYLLAHKEKELQLFQHLTTCDFQEHEMRTLLDTLIAPTILAEKQPLNPHADQLSQIVRAAYLALFYKDSLNQHHSQIEINRFSIESLPISIIRELPKETRKALFDTPKNFDALTKKSIFNTLSHDFNQDELNIIFKQFLENGFVRYKLNTEEGLVAFYRNLGERVFWTEFNKQFPPENNSSQRQQWLSQGMFGNPAFMQALSEGLWEDSSVKLAARKASQYLRSAGEQLGLLEKLSDRYASFTMDEMISLVNHYCEYPSEALQVFLADWLFLQLQSEQFILSGSNASDDSANDNAFLDALTWDENGDIALPVLNIPSKPKANKNSSAQDIKGLAQLNDAQMQSLEKLIGNNAFRGMMTSKYALDKSNLEKLVHTKAKRDAGNFAAFYDHYQKIPNEKFSLDAAQTTINLSISGSWNNRAWLPIKAIDYALLESARMAEKSKIKGAKQNPEQRKNWRKLLEDYVGSIGNSLDKARVLHEANKEKPLPLDAVHSQLTQVRKTILRLLSSGSVAPNAVEDTLHVLLERRNFLRLMDLYKINKDSTDPIAQSIRDEVQTIIGAMFIASPTLFLSGLAAFDRNQEWQFAVEECLKLKETLQGQTDKALQDKLATARVTRRKAILAGTISATAIGAGAGYLTHNATIKGALAGLAVGAAAGVAIEVGGRTAAGVQTTCKIVADFCTAIGQGINREELDNARCIAQDRDFEIQEQCKKRRLFTPGASFIGKSGFAVGRRRFKHYRPDLGWFRRPFYTLGRFLGIIAEPKSDFGLMSYRENIPDIYIKKADADTTHAIPNTIVLTALDNQAGKYACRFYNDKGHCIHEKFVHAVDLSSYNDLMANKTKLSGQEIAKTQREHFGKLLTTIETARNNAILDADSAQRNTYYDTSRTLVQGKHTGKTIVKAIKEDSKDFSQLNECLAITPFVKTENSEEDKRVNMTQAKANEADLRVALNIVNLTPGERKASAGSKDSFSISHGLFSSLYNTLTQRYTGNHLLEKEGIQTLKARLNELLYKAFTPLPFDNIHNRIVQEIISTHLPNSNVTSLIAPLEKIIDEQRVIMQELIKTVEKNSANNKDLTATLSELECRLSGLIKTAIRLRCLGKEETHPQILQVTEYCNAIQRLINNNETQKPAIAKALTNIMTNIQYECSHTAERLLISRLENVEKALENSAASIINDNELNNTRKKLWDACEIILKVYPEDSNIHDKYIKLSKDLNLITPSISIAHNIYHEVNHSFDRTPSASTSFGHNAFNDEKAVSMVNDSAQVLH